MSSNLICAWMKLFQGVEKNVSVLIFELKKIKSYIINAAEAQCVKEISQAYILFMQKSLGFAMKLFPKIYIWVE